MVMMDVVEEEVDTDNDETTMFMKDGEGDLPKLGGALALSTFSIPKFQ